ncbi:hypothetical protein GQ600_3316 [Phytophthora cactorum]|nr:hypothetical protein GQ600_3316 [Phytophthora cactorum]
MTDTQWDPFYTIAQRVIELRSRYAGHPTYAFGTDIAEAFLHVLIHSKHAPAFGDRQASAGQHLQDISQYSARRFALPAYGQVVRPRLPGTFQWVEDLVIIEVDIDDRLVRAERRLQDAVKLVIGSKGAPKGHSEPGRSASMPAVLTRRSLTCQSRFHFIKLRKPRGTLTKTFVTQKRLDSLVGVLRHVVTFIPTTKRFLQRLVGAQLATKRRYPMAESVRSDLLWWNQLIYENEDAGVP